MKAFAIIFLILSVATLVLGITLTATDHSPKDNWWDGKAIFHTESEYASFKEYVSQDSVRIVKTNVLNSGYPIVVEYEIVTKDKQIPFNGKIEITQDSDWLQLLVFGGILTIISTIVALTVFCGGDE